MQSIIAPIIMAFIMPFFIMARSIWIREETSKTFSGTIFAATQLISELPYGLACAVIFYVLLYYLPGFNYSSDRAGYFFAITLLNEYFAISLGTFIASFCKNAYQASLFVPFVSVILSLTAGVLSPPNQMSSTLYSKFFYNVNPVRFVISPLIANELQGLKVVCKPQELIRFSAPNGQTCADWAGNYLAAAGGYLANPQAMGECEFCPIATGEQFFAPIGISFANRGRDAGILVGFIAFNVIATMFFTKVLRFSNR